MASLRDGLIGEPARCPGDLELRCASTDDMATVASLLVGANLPYGDVAPHIGDFIVAVVAHRVTGAIGLELYGRVGLLRSLVVDPGSRKRGIGQQLCQTACEHAMQRGVRDLYLLTLDAEVYFSSRGFRRIERSLAPGEIRATRQFTGLCPETAVLMVRSLGAHGALAV